MRIFNMALLTVVFVLGLQAQAYKGALYEPGSGKKKLLYNMDVTITPGAGSIAHVAVTYVDTDGKAVVEQKITVDGSKIITDQVTHHQTGQKGLIEVKEGKVFFTKTADGKTTTKEEKIEDTFVTSGNFQRFVKDNWAEIMKGETISFRYGVWDRQETVGFKIFKDGEVKDGDKTLVRVKLKPSSFIIAAIVNPLIFTFPANGEHILEMVGRVPPKQKSGDKWKDLDAEVVYTY